MEYCPYCGEELKNNDTICSKCGKIITPHNNQLSKNKSKKQHYLVLCVLLLALFSLTAYFLYFNNFINSPRRIEKASQSVVKILVYNNNDELISMGSGFVAYNDSTIATNNHVICDAYKIQITTDQDITYDIISILCYDITKDIAVLKTSEPTGLKPLKFGNPLNIKKGEKVLTIGSPVGMKNTISTGILSGRIFDNNFGVDILQITAPISHGSSGGALFNNKGEVVGITFAGYDDAQNVNFAIPITILNDVYDSRKLLSERTILEYLAHNNISLSKYYNSEYVQTTDLFTHPDQYSKLISFEGYLLKDGSKSLIYPNLDQIGSENSYHDISYISCITPDSVGEILNIENQISKIDDGLYHVMICGQFYYYDGTAPDPNYTDKRSNSGNSSYIE
ncbi:MAG: trypsin-like peptidase domain-containing protein [Firmicutes bacterium]|nr:trypsin-like peptidase domain-containing protein [Bacillota bacterium]